MDSNSIPRHTSSQRVSPQSQSDEETSQTPLLVTSGHKVSIEVPSSPRLSKLNRLRKFFGFKIKNNAPQSNRKARVVVSSGSFSPTIKIDNKKSAYQRFKDLFRVPKNLFWKKRAIVVQPTKPKAKQYAEMERSEGRKLFKHIQKQCDNRIPAMRYSFYNRQVNAVNALLGEKISDRIPVWASLTGEEKTNLRQHLSNMLVAANFSDKSHDELLKKFDFPQDFGYYAPTWGRVVGELPKDFFDATPPTTPESRSESDSDSESDSN